MIRRFHISQLIAEIDYDHHRRYQYLSTRNPLHNVYESTSTIYVSFINLFCPVLFQTSYLNFYVIFYPAQRLEISVANNFIKRIKNILHDYYYYILCTISKLPDYSAIKVLLSFNI